MSIRYNCTENLVEIVKCLTYREIISVITFAKQFGRYDILLKALTAPENYESVLHEARTHNNHELMDDLQKTATALYRR